MACLNCKEKNNIKKELIKTGEIANKGVVWFAIIWFGLGVYGLITLIQKFL
jgi:hypothetical protein